ncbi:HAMP domain-containing histidine kinase [Arthrobacter gandavensis]|uniref:sensor histidine kinase n=1 Tax=Arthrobacter gandavensis TaxID=169960 RepID=UPI00188EA27C|nr:HAMP domain-containing histidine kinase [Arthrobacter gandavensis]MBF4995035.1 HAMP domain-containing histidine kinase [Arthrobacter gandavensis]
MFRPGQGNGAEPRRAARRLALQFTALTVVLLSLAGMVVYYLAATGAEGALQDRLESAAELNNPRDAPLDIFLAVYDRGRVSVSRDMPEGLPVESSLAAVAAGGGEVQETVEASGTTFRVLTRTDGRDVVQAAIDTSETRAQLLRRRLGTGSTEGGPAERVVPVQEFVESGLEDIIADAQVLTGILEDLLESADPRRAGPPEPVDLSAAARKGAEAFGPTLSGHGLRLLLDVPETPVRVRAGAAAVQRIVTALLANASDYARSTVWVQVSARGGEGVLRVSDDGPGLMKAQVSTL